MGIMPLRKTLRRAACRLAVPSAAVGLLLGGTTLIGATQALALGPGEVCAGSTKAARTTGSRAARALRSTSCRDLAASPKMSKDVSGHHLTGV
jgi:hypothetical protein